MLRNDPKKSRPFEPNNYLQLCNVQNSNLVVLLNVPPCNFHNSNLVVLLNAPPIGKKEDVIIELAWSEHDCNLGPFPARFIAFFRDFRLTKILGWNRFLRLFEIFWDFLGFFEIFWDFLRFFEAQSQYIFLKGEIFWDILRYFEKFLDILKYFEKILRNFEKFWENLRNFGPLPNLIFSIVQLHFFNCPIKFWLLPIAPIKPCFLRQLMPAAIIFFCSGLHGVTQVRFLGQHKATYKFRVMLYVEFKLAGRLSENNPKRSHFLSVLLLFSAGALGSRFENWMTID